MYGIPRSVSDAITRIQRVSVLFDYTEFSFFLIPSADIPLDYNRI